MNDFQLSEQERGMRRERERESQQTEHEEAAQETSDKIRRVRVSDGKY